VESAAKAPATTGPGCGARSVEEQVHAAATGAALQGDVISGLVDGASSVGNGEVLFARPGKPCTCTTPEHHLSTWPDFGEPIIPRGQPNCERSVVCSVSPVKPHRTSNQKILLSAGRLVAEDAGSQGCFLSNLLLKPNLEACVTHCAYTCRVRFSSNT